MLPFRATSRILIATRRRLVLLLVFFHHYFCCTTTRTAVHAWGKTGHEIVGNLAWTLLSPPTQDAVASILNETPSSNDKYCDEYCSPLADVADWADAVRYTQAYHWSGPLHYIDVQDETISGGCPANVNATNTDRRCHFDYARDCVDDFCVAGAIVNYTSQLLQLAEAPDHRSSASRKSAAALKNSTRKSLMFLIHFVGDCHQPLHVSRATDRGGNSIHVKAEFLNQSAIMDLDSSRGRGYSAKRRRRRLRRAGHHHPLNLHAVWDDSIIETTLALDYNNSRNALELSLMNLIWQTRTFSPSQWNSEWLHCADGGRVECTTEWGQESWNRAVRYAYRNVDGTDIVNGTVLTRDYYRTRLGIVRERLAVAGVRLASTLELAMGDHRAAAASVESIF